MTSRICLSVWAPAFGRDLRAAVPMIRQAGFQGVQLDAGSPMLDLTGLSSSARREVRHLLSAHDLQLASIRIETGAVGLGLGADVDRTLDRIDAIVNASAELTCGIVCVDLGRLPPAQRVAKPKPKVTQEMAGLLILPSIAPDALHPEAAIESEPPVVTKIDPAVTSHWQQAMGQLGEIADRYGAALALSAGLSSFAALASLLKQVDCPWFGVDLDTAALLRDEWSLDETFDAFGPLVRHVRARDAVKGEARRTRPTVVGRGDVAWRDLLTYLDDSGFTGSITIDPGELPDPAPAALAGVKQLRAFLE